MDSLFDLEPSTPPLLARLRKQLAEAEQAFDEFDANEGTLEDRDHLNCTVLSLKAQLSAEEERLAHRE